MLKRLRDRAIVAAGLVCFGVSGALGQEFFVANGNVAQLVDAINASNADPDPAVIHLATNGTYTLTNIVTTSNGLPAITSEITFNGNGATIQRSPATGIPDFRIFLVNATGVVTMNDLTIRWGYNRAGAGISNAGDVTLNRCTITENTIDGSTSGVGISNTGTMRILESTISNNRGGDGAGILTGGASANMVIIDSLITGNTVTSAGGGGAIRNSVSPGGSGGLLTIVGSTISNNRTTGANGHGGGISNAGQLTILRSEIIDNAANRRGGGIYHSVSGQAFVDITDTLISGNTAGLEGGGIYTILGRATLDNVTITGNSAESHGGGIYHDGTSANQHLTIENSLIAENSSDTWGGGLYSSRPVTMTDSVVRNNSAVLGGGGIVHTNNAFTLERSHIIDNTTEGNGAGLYNSSTSTFLIDSSTLSGNAADGNGGGINSAGLNIGSLLIVNSTISGNNAVDEGGGIHNLRTGANRITLVNSTVYNNAADEGGGIRNAGSNSSVRLSNSIVAGSNGGDIVGGYVDVLYNIVEDGVGLTNPTSKSGDPMLDDLTDNGGSTMTHIPLPGSPAINGGDCSVGAGSGIEPVTVDQRGIDRPSGPACDIGAVEFVCVPDWNNDGEVDINDFFAYLGDFEANDPRADLNNDGEIDINDFFMFLSLFERGC